MPIIFICPESSMECIYEKKYAGKTFKCMHCDQTHRVPGLDLSKTKDGKFIFHCEGNNVDFRLKNTYYGSRFHCPKCRDYHIAKPKGEVEDVSKLTPDIKPMDIQKEDPVKLSKEDRELRKRSSLNAKSTKAKLRRSTSVNAIKRRSTINTQLAGGSSTILMSVEDENDMLNEIINEQQDFFKKQSKKPRKLTVFISIILIPLALGIVFIIDQQAHSLTKSSLQKAQEHLFKMEIEKAISQTNRAIQSQGSKLLFYKEANAEDLKAKINHYKIMQNIYIRYENSSKSILANSTSAYDLHQYHKKLDKELLKFKEEDPIRKYLQGKVTALFKKEKQIVIKDFSKQMAKAKQLYADGRLQAAIEQSSHTYKSWKLLDHYEILEIHSEILAARIFFSHKSKIIAQINRIEDMTDTMGTLNDSTKNLAEAKALADVIISHLDETDTPLLKKVNELRSAILSKLKNTTSSTSQTPKATKGHDEIMKEFNLAVSTLETSLKELDGQVLKRSYPHKFELSSQNYSFTLAPLPNETIGGIEVSSKNLTIQYDIKVINFFPKFIPLHFRMMEAAVIARNSPDSLDNGRLQYSIMHIEHLHGPFTYFENNSQKGFLVNGKKYFIQERKKLDSILLANILKLIAHLKSKIDQTKNNTKAWRAFSEATSYLAPQHAKSKAGFIAKHLILDGYIHKIFPDLPAPVQDAISKINNYIQKTRPNLTNDSRYLARDGSLLKVSASLYADIAAKLVTNNQTNIYHRPFLNSKYYNSFDLELLLSFSSVYEGSIKDELFGEKPIQYNTVHPALGIIASYNIETKEFICDTKKWDLAFSVGANPDQFKARSTPSTFRPYCLKIDSKGSVKEIFTPNGSVKLPDFAKIKNKKENIKAKNQWISGIAKVLYHPMELQLISRLYYINEKGVSLKEIPAIKVLLEAARSNKQSLNSTLDRKFLNRIIGNDLDLAKLFTAITIRQNRLSQVIITPKGAVCCWVIKKGDHNYHLNILKAGAPLVYQGNSLADVLTKAFKKDHTDTAPFDPNKINIIIRNKNDTADRLLTVDSKVLIDRNLALKVIKDHQLKK